MEFSKTYNGAVFFVDLLGIGALTQNKIVLDESDFIGWERNFPFEKKNNQFLAAVLLTQFRQILVDIKTRFEKLDKDINVTQLSDCAFVWGESLETVMIFANNFMCEAIRKGVFCRGGLSYGEIIETTQEHENLGRFIVGNAVTNAVRAEGIAKGCRINCDISFADEFIKMSPFFYNKYYPRLVNPSYNYNDFSVYDEFRWYYFTDMDFKDDKNYYEFLKLDDRIKLTKERLKLARRLLRDNRFNWNAKNKEGRTHLYGSINFLSENESDLQTEYRLLNIKHTLKNNFIELVDTVSFDRKDESTLNEMLKKIDESNEYFDIAVDVNEDYIDLIKDPIFYKLIKEKLNSIDKEELIELLEEKL
ncbi:hypothetical protein MYRA21_2526 [Myroides sp. A21]|uniref:hypothetical protein n=1 Tax=Myroides sp. A21 TaxID=1583100 RepID=UPI000580A37B|nr:hypothetical protein [Myroides sp. A21]AJA69638.1 hypothetical protein MYRA21_2526 [Myroides sp. A21]